MFIATPRSTFPGTLVSLYDGTAVEVPDARHDAFFELLFEVTRMGRRTDRANLEKKPGAPSPP
jgi:hypothetical protein